jgi:hypothetical protein
MAYLSDRWRELLASPCLAAIAAIIVAPLLN